MKKKHIILLTVPVLALLIAGTVYANNHNIFFSNYGADMAKIYSSEKDSPTPAGTISKRELDITTSFYKNQGYSNEESVKKAKDYLTKDEALYLEAIGHGYTASDKEVERIISQLKEDAKVAENKDELETLIKQFPSEKDFWDHQFEVQKRCLPIRKYTDALKKEYDSKHNKASNKDSFSANNNTNYEKYYNKHVEELVNKHKSEIKFEKK